jgi:hypothetical protein
MENRIYSLKLIVVVARHVMVMVLMMSWIDCSGYEVRDGDDVGDVLSWM